MSVGSITSSSPNTVNSSTVSNGAAQPSAPTTTSGGLSAPAIRSFNVSISSNAAVINSILSLTPSGIAALSTSAVAAITTDVIAALSNRQVAAFTSSQIGALTTDQVAALTSSQMTALTSSQVPSLTTDDVTKLSPSQFAALSTASIASLTSAQIIAVPTADIAAMTTRQVKALTTAQMSELTTAEIHALTPTQIGAVTTAQAQALTTDQVAALTTAQTVALASADLAAMTTDQIKSVSTADIAAMTTRQAAAITSTLSLSGSLKIQKDAARRFVEKKIKKAGEALANAQGYRHKRLRIGYVSSDFCLHPVSLLTVEVFEKHDRERFEIFGFCHSPDDGSELRKRVIAAFDHFHSIKAMSDEEAARLIRAFEIDILIDLQGLTSGVRPDIFTFRPAPVQVTWLGFPGSSGHPQIDYVLCDKSVFPSGSEHGYTERPLRLPYCFQPSDNMRIVGKTPTRAECHLPDHAFVYCCFNNNYKFTPEMFTSWMRILARTPGSVLWLLADNAWSKTNLTREAERHGIDASRLIFASRVAPPDYLARYQLADLFLDTFPFNAGTTANDALWMGLPVLTRVGESFASRMAASLLMALGQPDFITSSNADYEDRAVAWASAREDLASRRQALRAARTTSRLYDMTLFVRDLEAALVSAIEEKIALAPPVQQTFLQINAGGQITGETLPLFRSTEWSNASPAWIDELQPIGQGDHALSSGNGKSIQAIFLNHYLPCCYTHEVPALLNHCLTSLSDTGFLIITCPDFITIAHEILAHGLTHPSYSSAAGPIAPIDMIFGHRPTLAEGHTAMAHHSGYTQSSLVALLSEAGFKSVRALARPEQFELVAVATKAETNDATFSDLLTRIFH